MAFGLDSVMQGSVPVQTTLGTTRPPPPWVHPPPCTSVRGMTGSAALVEKVLWALNLVQFKLYGTHIDILDGLSGFWPCF